METMETSFSTNDELDDFWTALNLENLTEAEYLERVLGPKYLPLSLVVPLTLAYVTIFVTGVFGNVTTCVVIIKNDWMQNATNYYLFSLAISDLTLLILGLPNELSVFWQQYPWALGVGLCKTRAYVSEMSSYVSVMTIVAFSTERYLAICHPLNFNAMSGSKRPIRIIVAVWLIAMVSALPFAIYTHVNYIEYPPGSGNYSADSAICGMLLPLMPVYPIYELSCLIFFLIPMLIILILYAQMGLKIRNSVTNSLGPEFHNNSIHGESRKVRSRKSIVKMLSAVVILFFICWAPFHAQRLFYVYAQESDYYPDLSEWLYILSGCLYYFSTTVNPILYNLMSSRYREAFKKILCKSKTRRNRFHGEKSFKDTSDYRCSLRYTIDQAKEIFRLNSSSVANGRHSTFSERTDRENHRKAENHSVRTFIRHDIAKEKKSNESTTSDITLEMESQTNNLL